MMNQNSPVWKLLTDLSTKPGITEIIINNFDNIFIERENQFTMIDTKLKSEDIDSFILEVSNFNGQNFNENNPILDGILPDGSRINIISNLYTNDSHAITIRKYNLGITNFDQARDIFGLSQKFKDFFKVLVRSRLNLIISGGTGVGKTTMLNFLLNEISPDERIVTIEDTSEINIQKPNMVKLLSKKNFHTQNSLTTRDLVKNTLRMRPDRIVIGEIRGGEFFDFLQAMNTGHNGSITTIHSNGARQALTRMESLYLLALTKEVPLKAIRFQIAQALNFIIQVSRTKDGKRVVSSIQEITGMEEDKILTQDIAILKDGKIEFTGLVPSCMKELIPFGLKADFFMDF